MPSVTVSILTAIGIEHVKRCIASFLLGNTEVALILTANGCPEAADYFRSLAESTVNIQVVVNDTNEGFWKPQNHALTLCDTEWFVTCNDDVTVPPDWFDRLSKPFASDPRAAFSCPQATCSEIRSDGEGKPGRREYCEASLMLTKTKLVQMHGLFSELPGKAYCEDSDASLRYRQKGYNLHWVPLHFNHARGATSKRIPEAAKWLAQNKQWFCGKWMHYMKVRRFGYPILLKRRAARGDVLLVTALVRKLRQEMPLSPIQVETDFPELFARNPDINSCAKAIPRYRDTLLINLDNCYERNPQRHVLDSYAEAAKVAISPSERITQVYPSAMDRQWAEGKIMADGSSWVALHAGPTTWPSKNWPLDRWSDLAGHLLSQGYKVALFYGDRHKIPHTVNIPASCTLLQMAAIFERCKLMIGLCSCPAHLAQAVGTPIITIHGPTLPELFFTAGSRHIGLTGDREAVKSIGMRNRIAGKNYVECPMDAILSVETESVIAATVSMLADCPSKLSHAQ